MNWKCFLLGHKDPIIDLASLGILTGMATKYEFFESWKNVERGCEWCGKQMRPDKLLKTK